jgi:hypothetical protein
LLPAWSLAPTLPSLPAGAEAASNHQRSILFALGLGLVPEGFLESRVDVGRYAAIVADLEAVGLCPLTNRLQLFSVTACRCVPRY